MAEASVAEAVGAAAANLREPDHRGDLIIADRAIEKVALHAALEVPGVVERQGAVGSLLGSAGRSLTGPGLPRTAVDSTGSARRLAVTVALEWPCRITDVCCQVRSAVADEVEYFSGVRPLRVDVTVGQLVPRGEITRRKKGYVDLPSPGPAVAEDRIDDRDDRRAEESGIES
ncbi:Asp23/Gls24 family envelope stress response protein [Gordonia zhaorongruii]|uniref:Asp23/Gls24 family envelope stress response protein n=1 Tax=Gordonia zhaorongruii TaxID=2597659 RepID=UPI0010430EA1|nr:Asp23/Gls24 family envelope stress response protein [Gordonia zhaorongruii]